MKPIEILNPEHKLRYIKVDQDSFEIAHNIQKKYGNMNLIMTNLKINHKITKFITYL